MVNRQKYKPYCCYLAVCVLEFVFDKRSQHCFARVHGLIQHIDNQNIARILFAIFYL